MELKNDNEMVVTDSEGKEHLMHILFTYDNEERGCSYVFFYEVGDNEENVMVMRYTAEGELEEVDDPRSVGAGAGFRPENVAAQLVFYRAPGGPGG